MKGVILHGGQGTRLRPLTYTGPKQLISIAGKPISQWALEKLVSMGVSDVIIVLGDNHPEKVIDYYGDGRKFGTNIKYVYQGKARGIAEAVYRCRDLLDDDDFIVYLGDNIVIDDISNMRNDNYDASILLANVEDPRAFGVAVLEGDRIVKLVEKPKEIISKKALVGVYRFNSYIFDVIERLKPSARGELEITEAIQAMIDQGKKITYSMVNEWWKDTGNPRDLLESNMKLLDKYGIESVAGTADNSTVLGRVQIGKDSVIKNSKIVGPVYIGEETIISDSYVGPFTSIGKSCNVERSKVEYSLIFDQAKLADVNLSESIIGQNSNVRSVKSLDGRDKLTVGENSNILLGD